MKGKTAQVKAYLTGIGYKTDLSTKRHTMIADGSPSGEGFNPGEILASALGSCMSMTTMGFARMKKLPLDAIEIDVKLSDGRSPQSLAHFDIGVRLFGNLTEEERNEILTFTSNCHIHEILKNPSSMDIHMIADTF
jgi:uncharacterized OsmC-like protein